MTEIVLNKDYPTFLCTVMKDKLVTNADWYRTAFKGSRFLILASEPSISKSDHSYEFDYSCQHRFKKRFNKPLYLDMDGTLKLTKKKDDTLLLIDSETLYGADIVECVYLDGHGMNGVGICRGVTNDVYRNEHH